MYNVEEIWQIPPPIPSTTAPFSYTFAVLYPALVVLAPKVLLYENVSPGNTIFSSIFLHAISRFVDLSLSPPSYLVEYELIFSGNASEPKFDSVTCGFVICNGISYCSLFSSSIFFASSILKSIPITSG